MRYFELTAALTQALQGLYDEREAGHLARRVVERASGLDRTQLTVANREEIPAAALSQAEAMQARLVAGEPWQYITGEAEFCGHSFTVGPGVLIPRPETELLVELALSHHQAHGPARVLDACTGSGCVGLSVALAKPHWQVSAFDISPDALAYARQNADKLGASTRLFEGDVLADPALLCPAGELDILLSNPPYIPLHEKESLATHVHAHEPALALFAPSDEPLLFYLALEKLGRHALAPGGMLAAELHAPLANETLDFFMKQGWRGALQADLFGRLRVLVAQR